MKRIVFCALVAATAAASWAYLGQVVGSFPSPAGTQTRGLAISSSYLFVVDGTSPGLVYRCYPNNGSVRNWYQLGWAGNNSGLALSATAYLWVGCTSNNRVYRCHAPTGSIYDSWSAGHDPFGCAPLATGDGGVGTSYIYTTDTDPSAIFTHQLWTGSIVRSVAVPNRSDYDCAYDWRNRVVWLGDSPDLVYGYSFSGTVVGSFRSPAASPRGLTYYGEYLYVGCASNGYIYRVHCPLNFIGAAPASVGKVKALFR
jgi:hypothetical protein